MTSHRPLRNEYSERRLTSMNGYAMIAIAVVLVGVALARFVAITEDMDAATVLLSHVLPGALCILATVAIAAGLYTLQPNEAAIMTLFGKYAGSDRAEGLRWANPFFIKRRISLRARNLNSPALKVNDKRGNPVEIGAVIIWRVEDTAKARFEVDDVELYVKLQSEAALRHVASLYAYDEADSDDAGEITLRGGLDAVASALQTELSARFASAGVAVTEARLTHLAYAPEIAQVMLRRQQAEAVISARHKIVQGAVAMVESALTALSERNVVTLDDERKAAMVSNLLVVLCGDKDTQPIINAGTLYS
jgi:regulator of protease activity HflC (stomatin/prohibitin superfamily)